jgi:hypothetical protein
MFGKNKTLESSLAAATAAFTGLTAFLRTAFSLTDAQAASVESGDHAPLIAAIAALTDRATAAEAQVSALTIERDAAQASLATAGTDRDTAAQSATDLRTAFRTALNMSEEQFTAFAAGDNTILATAVNTLATAKAVDIAASQGIPPVATMPGATGSEKDEIALAYEAAANEPDAKKRGALFARASALIAKKSKSGSN